MASQSIQKLFSMTDREKLHEVARRLALPQNDYIFGGSSVMVLHGMDRQLGDVDIFTTTERWFEFIQHHRFVTSVTDDFSGMRPLGSWVRYWSYEIILPDGDDYHRFDPPILRYKFNDLGIDVDLFYNWKVRNGQTDTDLIQIWENSRVVVDGLPCSTLTWLRDWKIKADRPKDREDVEAITRFLDETFPDLIPPP
jgi:hypothetical protein